MKWVQGAYTQRYNGRHKLRGHLFQGRYKAVIVDGQAENYFAVVSTYIHLNAARAKLIRIGAEQLKRYRWSSYPWYLNRAGKRPGWLRTDRVLGSLGLGPKEVKGYEVYLEGRVLELGRWAGRMPKGAPEKGVLARRRRRRTTVSLRWVSERLGMGHYSRVTQAVHRAGRRPSWKLNRIKRKLARVETLNPAGTD